MKTFYFRKLVRDKVLQRCLDDPQIKTFHYTLSPEEYHDELIKKLHEEVDEIDTAVLDEDLLSEIADVQEVLDAIAELHGFTKEVIQDAQDAKNHKNGAFIDRAYIEKVELDDDSEWVSILRQQPEKYEEV